MFLLCDLEKPRKAQKKDLKKVKIEEITEKTLKKLQDFLNYRKFDSLKPCRCINCFESYESFNSAYSNLLYQIPKTSSVISKLKNERKNHKADMVYLHRVESLIQKIGQQFEKVFRS